MGEVKVKSNNAANGVLPPPPIFFFLIDPFSLILTQYESRKHTLYPQSILV